MVTQGRGKWVTLGLGIVAVGVIAIAVWVGWPRIYFWYLFEPLGWNAQGFAEHRHRQTGIVFVRLPGGMFSMGAQKDDPGKPNHDPEAEVDEGPVHDVTLSPFLIAKYEVTKAQWKKVMGSIPSGSFSGDEDRPVEMVSWEDIQKFESITGLTLPTEAEWEYACRAGTTTVYAGKLEDLAWFKENETHRAGTKASNRFGLHDLHGNVNEVCEDVYDKRFYGRPEAEGPDPVSTAGSDSRVFRGGSWGDDAWNCRSANRFGDLPVRRALNFGFRAACRWPSP